MGLPPHADNEARVPFSMSVVGAGAPVEPAALPDPAAQSVARLGRIEQLCRAEGVARTLRAAQLRDKFQAFIAPREKAAARKWSRFYIEQRDRVLARVRTLPDAASAVRADLGAGLSADEMVRKIFPATENGELAARLTPLWTEHLRDGFLFFNAETGIEPVANPFEVSDPNVIAALERRTIQGSKVNETTAEDLRGLIGKAMEDGLSTAQLGDAIAEYYGAQAVGETSARPLTAARTQTAGIVNDGRMISARNVGGLKKTWIHGNPKEPRESHLAAARQYQDSPIALDEKFVVEGEEMDAPGDAAASPANTVNCTCMVGFVKSAGD
jgi:hypothetical protein